MVQLIRTPEQIFREERRDIYALRFLQRREDDVRQTRQEMHAWFAKHMPDSRTESLAPSEHSGFIVGGPIELRIAFTDDDLQQFCQRWETPDGKSNDPRFQCYQYSYLAWWNKRGHYQPTLERPNILGPSVWVVTPLGILSHVLSIEQGHYHSATVRDIWANACEQWPEFKPMNLDDLSHGQVVWSEHANKWLLLWNAPFSELWEFAEKTERWRKVADWLGLPSDSEIASEY